MDAFELLQHDHRHASSLMSRIKAHIGEADASPVQIFKELEKALDLHARVEELHVYYTLPPQAPPRRPLPALSGIPAIRNHERQCGQRTGRSSQDKVLLEELTGMPRVDYRWVQKFNELYEAVGRHMHIEEEELCGQAGEALTRQEAKSWEQCTGGEGRSGG